MGQSICLSLVRNIKVDKSNSGNISLPQATEIINEGFPTDLALFELQENQKEFNWTLKNSVFEWDLLPFLEKFYPSFYQSKDEINHYQTTLAELYKNPNTESWLNFMEEGGSYFFQKGDACELDYFRYFNGSSYSWLSVYYETIILTSTGKISLEMHGGLLRYLGESTQLRFSEFPLAKCLKVHISG